MNEGPTYFEDSLFEDGDAYHGMELNAVEPLEAMSPFSSEQVAPSEDPGFLDQGMGAWDPFPGGQFGVLPAEPKQLFVDPGLCDAPNENDDMRSQIQVLEAEVSRRPSTRRTSSTKSELQWSEDSLTGITPPDQNQQPKKRKPKKKKGPDGGEEKRNRFLERNRIAASKCREKKKMFVSELEEQKVLLEAKNAALQATLRGLSTEVSNLKHQLMTHAKCNDANIDKWLSNEASRYVHTPQAPPSSSDFFGQPFAGFNAPGPPVLPPESPGTTRDPSFASAYQAAEGGPPVLPAGSSGATRNPSFASTYPTLQGGQPALAMESPGGTRNSSLASACQGLPGGPPSLSTGSPASSRNPSFASVYHGLPGGPFDSMGAGERHNSIAYSHRSSLYTEPTPVDPIFPCLNSPHPKKEPDINFDHMPDDMFDADQPSFGPSS